MFDVTALFSATNANANAHRNVISMPASYAAYRGPERRSAASQGSRWLALMLDEIDYGMVLLSESGQVLHVNHAARAELDADHPLQLTGRELRPRLQQDVSLLQDALLAAQRGLRRLVTLGDRSGPLSVAVVPLGSQGGGAQQATLLLLGKKHVCESLSVQCFARSHALTPAETRVLEKLCSGLDPREVAQEHGVGLATVRTQIGSIRAKTGTESIRDLVRRVAVLPPMVSSLRAAA
jgi:DNA-binding CsgD family transcriptional regulator